MSSLNASVDPCEDFYEFATGGWQASHDIPADRGLYGSFNSVADNNKKIILKVLDAIPSDNFAAPSANDENLHKLKAVYTSCMDVVSRCGASVGPEWPHAPTDNADAHQGELNERGFQPFEPMANHLLDIFEPFDLIPPSYAESLGEAEADEWRGAWTDAYDVPETLKSSARRFDALKAAKIGAGIVWDKPVGIAVSLEDALVHEAVDETRQGKITKTLAWLHSRGQSLEHLSTQKAQNW